jgi:hypothetical protein
VPLFTKIPSEFKDSLEGKCYSGFNFAKQVRISSGESQEKDPGHFSKESIRYLEIQHL